MLSVYLSRLVLVQSRQKLHYFSDKMAAVRIQKQLYLQVNGKFWGNCCGMATLETYTYLYPDLKSVQLKDSKRKSILELPSPSVQANKGLQINPQIQAIIQIHVHVCAGRNTKVALLF